MPPRKLPDRRNRLRVTYRGEELGILTWNPDKRLGYFFFSEGYFRKGYDLCPITHPKGDPSTRFAIYGESLGSPDRRSSIYQGLPPFIADSLPDRWGNAVFDEWFAARNLPEEQKTPLTKLSFIGNRAMGALEFHPMMEQGFYEDRPVDLSELYVQSLRIERDLESKSVNPEKADISQIAALGTSPGGSQKKAVVSIAPDGTYHSGKTSPTPGWRHCILKFNSPEFSLAEIEKTYYDLAQAAGLGMMESGTVTIGGSRHFITERFDRKDGMKVMTQTLAAINPDAETYEDLFATCRLLGIPENETARLFRQTAFNFIMSNTDDHRKNFSFLLGEDDRWHLAPPYDLNFIIATNGTSPERNHCMTLLGKSDGVTDGDLIKFARLNDVKNPERTIREVRETSMLFEETAEKNGVSPFYTELIGKRLNELGRKKELRRAEEFETAVGGKTVTGLTFELSEKGNIHVHANVDGQPRRIVLTPKKPLHAFILENGFNGMDDRTKEKVARETFGKSAAMTKKP